ncbi:MAG TPA: IS1 family transposase, partial [Saprospiraceae bacterium]|nr:IS1 family transposase [Saprospiraceae bacterium]
MNQISCPKCSKEELIKSGVIKGRQRFNCKTCNYSFTVLKQGKSIDPYYVIKSLQLYIEGISFREIERILGISHVSVMNWVKKYN